MNIRLAATSLLACGILVTVACSSSTSGGGGSGPGGVSSVDSSKTVNGLSDSEAKQYCEDAIRFSEGQVSEADSKKIGCGISAQIFGGFGTKTDAEAQAKCKEQLEACLSKPDAEPAGADGGASKDPCADFKERAKDCTATVAEVNQCVSDSMAQQKSLASKDFCAEAKVASADGGSSSTPSPFEQPASCKAIEGKCPGLAGGDGEGEGNPSDQ